MATTSYLSWRFFNPPNKLHIIPKLLQLHRRASVFRPERGVGVVPVEVIPVRPTRG